MTGVIPIVDLEDSHRSDAKGDGIESRPLGMRDNGVSGALWV